jgi:hypothetical protein
MRAPVPRVATFVAILALGSAAGATGGDTFGELGANDFRISVNEGTGDPDYDAVDAAVAYNPTADEYLVVWAGHEDCGVFVGENREIFAQRLGGKGPLIGPRIGISRVGPDCDPDYRVFEPAVTYNAIDDEYLVVWSGEDNVGGLVLGELEIFGQLVTGDGILTGPEDFRISDMAGTGSSQFGAASPDVTWNGTANEYLVVWHGDDNVGGLVDNERESFGQRLDGNAAEIGANDFRISDAGGTGDPSFAAVLPAVAWNATDNEYLVVWHGDDNVGGLVLGESEIFGQRLSGNGTALGVNDFRISDMGGTGDGDFVAAAADVIWNATENEYLVVWHGSDNVGGLVAFEAEIFGQRLDANAAEIGANDFRISDAGGTGDPSFAAVSPATAWNAIDNEYLVVWHGDDNVGGLVDGEDEIFGQRLSGNGTALGVNDFRISDTGPQGDPSFAARQPAVAWSGTRDEYLVVWHGDDNVGGLVDNELEIFGQRLGDPLIFADGFESGGTAAWGEVVE